MTRLATLAPGKVNLCLFVGRPEPGGLHPLVSVVQPVSLADELVLEPAPGAAADEVVCPGVEGPNLAARALALYRTASGWDGPAVRLRIHKRVPVAGGMGGGSADAAGALRLAAAAAGAPADPLVRELAPRLGSDVPALLAPVRSLVTGTGARVQPLDAGDALALVVVPSPNALATADVYREADRLGAGREPAELARLGREVRAAGPLLPEPLAVNDLGAAARALCPAIGATIEAVLRAGADRALVSGSGPTVFGAFIGEDGPVRARAAAAALPRGLVVGPAPPGSAAVRALP